MTIQTTQTKKLAYLYLLITFFAWGSLYVVGKFVLTKIPTFTVCCFRYILAGILLTIILKFRHPKKIEKQDYKYIFLIGFFGYFLAVGSQLLGIKLSNATLPSLINSMNPIAIMVFAAILLKERMTVRKGISIVLAIAGAYVIIGGASVEGYFWGIMASLFALVVWAFISVVVRRVTQKYDALQITAYGSVIAAVCNIPVAGFEIANTPGITVDFPCVLGILYMGIVCTALAYLLWNKSLSMLEASTCSLFYPVQPLVSVLLGFLFLQEAIDRNFIIGAVLIVGGVLLSIIEKKPENIKQKS